VRKATILTIATMTVASTLLAPFPTQVSAATTTYQAEDGQLFHGTVDSDHAGFTGRGFVNGANEVGSWVQVSVTVGTAGNTALAFRFANGTSANRPMSIAVDGTTVATPAFAATGSWTSWTTTTVNTTMTAGTHTVRATSTTASGGPNLDSLTVTDNGGGGGGAPTAAELLAKVTGCNQISNGLYRTDEEAGRTIPVCDKNGAVFWKADMDIDCDGIRTAQCNEDTDCCFLPDTAFHDSQDRPLNSAQLSYVVVPSPSSTWDYRQFGIRGGGAVAIIFNNRIEYAVVGDTGPTAIIGEASYHAASVLGIDPDPSSGGTDSGVTYIFFKNSTVSPIENHNQAVTLGQQLARQFINNN
jgi:hypothetical protein